MWSKGAPLFVLKRAKAPICRVSVDIRTTVVLKSVGAYSSVPVPVRDKEGSVTMPHRIETAKQIVVGTKQTLKALQNGTASLVYVAEDAEERVVSPVKRLGAEKGIPIVPVATMAELGRLCRIDVGAAAVAIIAPKSASA